VSGRFVSAKTGPSRFEKYGASAVRSSGVNSDTASEYTNGRLKFMASFRFRHQLQSRFRDCDLFGHVNNAVYFTYMEEARWAYWRELTGDFPHDRLPGLILARVECDFIRPVNPGERIDVWMGTTNIGRTSMSIDCEMLDQNGQPVAKGKAVMVTYDYSTSKPVPVPDWARTRIEEYEGRRFHRISV